MFSRQSLYKIHTKNKGKNITFSNKMKNLFFMEIIQTLI